ncbi:YJL088Wp-like protein [Saccharomyces cerevisiae AWRI1631]|nr:YJL088Wp-like protein [Saccharomyces cerevisiae AWRI1631]
MLSCSVSFRDDKKLVIFSVKCNSQQYRPLRNARTNFFEPDWSPFLSSARLPIPVHPKKSTYINRLFTSKGSLFLVCPLSTVNNELIFFFFLAIYPSTCTLVTMSTTASTPSSLRHLISIKDLSDEEFRILVQRAQHFKNVFKANKTNDFQSNHLKLLGRTIALIFTKRSTRTRISTEGAATFFGAQPMFLGKEDIQLGVNESFYDTTKVVSSMVSCIFARVNKHEDILAFCKDSSVPIINSLCDKFHPLQAICDLLTIIENFNISLDEVNKGINSKLKMAWIGDANNVINDMCIACLKFGISVSISTPPGIEMDSDIVDEAKKVAERNGATFELTHDSLKASTNANILVTDTFVSMGEEFAKQAKLKQFKGFQINQELVSVADPNYKFMHCLPRHQEEVSDDVFYGEHSIVFEEAENRLYAAMSAIDIFVNNKGNFKDLK